MTNVFTAKKVSVPGILDDDALAIQLDLLKKQQTDTAKVAPPPDAAYDFADRLQQDYLSQPQPTVRVSPQETPGLRLSPEQQADRQRAGGIVDAIGRPAASLGMGILGPAMEGLRQIGTLTEEESELATQEAVEDAKEREQAVNAQADVRAKLRAMPDAEAAELGLPVAPGGTDEVARGAGLVQDLNIRKEAAKDVETAEKEPVTQTWWLNAAQTAARSVGEMGTGALRNGPIIWELVRDVYQLDQLTGDGRSNMRAWVDTADAALNAMLPGDKAQSRDFLTTLAAGTGSFAGFMVAGFIGSSLGLPPGVTTGALGAALGGQQGFREAEQFGAGGIQKYWSYLLNAGLGAMEAVPIDRMFMRANTSTGGLVMRMLQNTPAASLQEFLQEFSQAMGEDIIAKYLAGFDPDRELDAREWVKQGIVGAVTGGAGGAVTSLSPIAGAAEVQPPPDEAQALVDAAMRATQLRFDQIEGIGDVADQTPPAEGIELATEAVETVDPEQAFIDRMNRMTEARANNDLAEGERFVSVGEGRRLSPDDTRRGQPVVQYDGKFYRAPTHKQALQRVVEQFPEAADIIDANPEAHLGFLEQEAEAKTGTPVTSRGGTMPTTTREDGRIELTHWAAAPRATLDPTAMGTGPLRGQERARLVGPDAVPRTYYGVNARASFPKEDLKAMNAELRKAKTREQEQEVYRKYRKRAGYVREGGLGNVRHTVSVDPETLYNWFEDPLDLKAGLDRELSGSEQMTQYERLIRDAGFAGYFIDEGPQGQTVALFEAAEPESIIDERTGEALTPPDSEFEAKRSPAAQPTLDELTTMFPGLKGVIRHLTPAEQKKVTRRNAARLVELFEGMPDAKEMAAVAVSGRAKRGWYANSARALVEIFGVEDAPRFAGLLAALSPQNSVESNTVNALNTWVNWNAAGRPQDRKSIVKIMGQSVEGSGTEASVLDAWVNNSIRALTAPDPTAIVLSGPKVDSFMRNLWGVVNEVTNDAWMANFANIDQKLLQGRAGAADEQGQRLEKSPGYLAMSAVVRAAADAATKMTGETWTASEIQETVWSWAKTLYETAGSGRTALEILNANGLTAEAIASTPDFATLFASNAYRNILEKGGYNVENLSSGRQADATDRDASPSRLPQGSEAAQEAFERHLRRAARRLDELRARRQAEAIAAEQAATGRTAAPVDEDGLPQPTGEVVDDVPFFEESRVEAPEFAGFFDEYEAMRLGDADLSRLPGLPKESTGPIESVVRAARAYAASIGLRPRRQAEYVKADPARGKRIAQAYEEMAHNPSDPAVAAAYRAMIDETLAQYQFVKASGLKVEAIEPGQPDPYPEGPKQVLADLQDGHLWFFPTDQGFGSLPPQRVFHAAPSSARASIQAQGLLRSMSETAQVGEVENVGEVFVSTLVEQPKKGLDVWAVDATGLTFEPDDTTEPTLTGDTWWKLSGDVDPSRLTLVVADGIVLDAAIPTAGNPLLEPTGEFIGDRELLANDVFRIVHDFFGHGIEGSGFGARGEENAWQSHMRLYTQAALPAVTSETRGQNSWVNFGPFGEQNRANQRETVYADQKTGIMPSWTWTEGVADDAEFDAMFVGGGTMRSAMGQPYEVLATAKRMADEGRDMRDIWTATGYFMGVDGRWRFEITDRDAEFSPAAIAAMEKTEVTLAEWKLGDMLVHDKLFAAYPALRDITVTARLSNQFTSETGQFDERLGDIEINGPNEEALMDVLLHEVQHAVQAQEGFSRGGNLFMGEIYEGPDVDAARQNLDEVTADPLSTAGEIAFAQERVRRAAAFEYYNRIAGEVEARNAAERGMHARAGRQYAEFYGVEVEPQMPAFPEDTADVPVDQQIVIMRTPTSMAETMMAETPPEGARSTPVGTAAARGPYDAEQTRPPQGIPETPDNAETDASLAQISKNFINLLNLTVRQGRFTLKGSNVWGQYTARQRTIRLKVWNDLSTLVHEGGHALHDIMAGPLRSFVSRNEADIMKVADDNYGGDTNTLNRQQHIREGFAEFFRLFALNRAFAERQYPDLHDQFVELLNRENPQLLQGLDLIQQQFMAYLQAPSTAVLRGMMVPGIQPRGINAAIQELRDVGFRSWMNEYARQTLEASVNRFAGLNSLVSQMLNIGQRNQGAAVDLTHAKDPRTLARLAPNFGARAMIQLTDGIMPYHSTEPASASLRDAILVSQGLLPADNPRRLDERRLEDFDEYLIALRAIDEYRRYAEGKIDRPPVAASLGDVTQAASDLAKKYDTFSRAAQMVHDFGMAMWKKQFDAGLMTRETYLEGLDRQFYVPLQRDMSDKQSRFPGNALTGQKSLVKRFRGSDRQIVSPTAALMHKLFSLERIIAENEVKRSLAQLADRVGTAGALVERIPATQIVGQNFSVRDIARQLTKDDSISAADAVDLLTILGGSIKDGNTLSMFRSEQVHEGGENILFFLDEGKVQAIQLKDGDLGADIVNMLNGLGRENMGFGMELIAGTSQIYRAAITAWPDFLIINFIRDQIAAWVLNNVGFIPFATGFRGMLDEVRQRQWAKRYNAAMGIMGGMNVAALHKARMERDITSLKNKGYVHMAFGDPGFMGAVAGFSRVMELSETGTRLGLFRKAYERAKADGLDDWEAAVEASYLATDYFDFGLNGNRMLAARRVVPFLNAQLQGFYKMLRTLGGDEVRQRKGLKFVLKAYFKSTKGMDLSRVERNAIRTGRAAWVKMSILGMLSALIHFIFEDDEDYQEVGEYMRVTNWVIPLGDGRIVSIPKPFELAMIANAVERGLEHAAGDDTAKMKFLRGAMLSLTPPTAPPAIQSLVEFMANKDFFTGQEIVPDYMAALPPELQYNNYTSELAKEIGQITGWSPLVLEHFMSGLGASAYRDMTTMTNALDPNRPNMDATDAPIARRFVRDVRRGSQTSKDFWAQASMLNGKLRTAETGYKTYLEQGNEPAANRYLNSLSDDEQAYALLATHFKADSKRLNPFYRGRQISTIISGMRREIVSELGLEDTDKFSDTKTIRLTSKRKAQVDELLSEIARREMRNTLVATSAPGWTNKKQMPVEPTMALLEETSPRAYAELVRRLDKAKVYDGQAVFEGWPEVRDRLIQDREDAFLDDMVTAARAFR